MTRRLFPVSSLAIAVAVLTLAAGCGGAKPQVSSAPPEATIAAPPPPQPSPDPNAAPVERASPPVLTPVALGVFEPGTPVSIASTGKLTIDDLEIRGENGASFKTERVAIVKGGDQYIADHTYSEAMMVDAGQPVELRRVVEQTPPKESPANAFCGGSPTGFLALAKVVENGTDVIKVIALQGTDLPAASAKGVTLCASTNYLSSGDEKKKPS